MSLSLQISRLGVPELEFAGSGYFSNPRRGLIEAGPFDLRFGSAHRAQIRLAIVGTADLVELALAWFDRCRRPIRFESRDKRLLMQLPPSGRSRLLVKSFGSTPKQFCTPNGSFDPMLSCALFRRVLKRNTGVCDVLFRAMKGRPPNVWRNAANLRSLSFLSIGSRRNRRRIS